ncbi:MAG TPA: M48 family metallopeptidase [Turneriella sp.]|nr:M48 family metallopeptidase [Turneriella sp.]HNE18907.1 M48 family metallopeptidase [Turneriella sp.]HNJ65163.1 M48 family metallopeptidase [Turneriella sp.]HNL09321.1 M48 family metallopeptidase [Turneriella sp.]HNL55315.1 M48 family metallopeptidase [Turneriella sp.]
MIRQAPAQYLDGIDPRPRTGRLVFDEAHGELHFYETDTSGIERFIFSVNKNHTFEIRSRGGEHVIEWREAGNASSRMLTLGDIDFVRLVRDRFLAHKNIFWRYATLVWSESLGKVALALIAALAVTGIAGWFFMQNSYKVIPIAWDKKIGEQAEPGLKEFGLTCASPQTVRDLKKLIPYLAQPGTPYSYDIQIIKSNVENAFALPGGKLTFFSETIKNAKSYGELAGILAHEIGHVERRHGMQQLSQYMTIRVILALAFGMTDDATLIATAADAGALLLLLKNSRDHERDADAYAAEKLVAAGISNRPIREFFERIAREHKKDMQNVPDFILTHPADNERIRFFEKYEIRHKAAFRTAAAKLNPEISALLKRKPVLAAECIAPLKSTKKNADDDEEGDAEP